MTKSQQRLRRRRLCWLAHLVLDRTTLLMAKTISLPGLATEVDGRLKQINVDVGASSAEQCHIDDQMSWASESLDVSFLSCPDEIIGGGVDETTHGAVKKTLSSPMAHLQETSQFDVFTDFADVVATISTLEVENCLRELDDGMQRAVKRMYSIMPLADENFELEDEDWLPEDSVVIVDGPYDRLCCPFSDSIGIVIGTLPSRRKYQVKLLATGRIGLCPWQDIDQFFEASLCGLVQRPSLNNHICNIEGHTPSLRFRVRIDTGERILVKPESLKEVNYDVFDYASFWGGFDAEGLDGSIGEVELDEFEQNASFSAELKDRFKISDCTGNETAKRKVIAPGCGATRMGPPMDPWARSRLGPCG